MLYLLLLFTVVPLVEFSLLWEISKHITLLGTVLLVIATGVLGASLARWQGVRTLWRIREETAQGRMPGDALLDGVLILVAGAVLITPGVLTDALGFALLIPPLRALVKRGLRRWVAASVRVQAGGFRGGSAWSGGSSTGRSEVIDAEVIETHVEHGRDAAP